MKTFYRILIFFLRSYTKLPIIKRGKFRFTRYQRILLGKLYNSVLATSYFGDTFELRIPEDNNRIGIFSTGFCEKTESIFLNNVINKNDIIIDVGANIGWYTILFARKGKFCHSFEPNFHVFSQLKKNVELNNLTTKCKLNNFALGDKQCESELFTFNGLHHGYASLSNKNREDATAQNIRLNTLTNYINENDIKKIDFIKIDIEGAEYKFLLGAVGSFSLLNNCIFMIEINNAALNAFGNKSEDVFKFFKVRGFIACVIVRNKYLKIFQGSHITNNITNYFFLQPAVINKRGLVVT